jgi:hypothetical protein
VFGDSGATPPTDTDRATALHDFFDSRVSVLAVPESLSQQAQAALGDVAEGICSLCQVGLRIHDGRACCPCRGDSYRAGPNRLEMRRCAEHGRDCGH